MVLTQVSDATFSEVVLQSDKPVLVDYWAQGCSPCKQLTPIIEELAAECGDRISFVMIDTAANPLSPAQHHVMALPTLQLFHRGEVVKSFRGAKNKAVLLKALKEFL